MAVFRIFSSETSKHLQMMFSSGRSDLLHAPVLVDGVLEGLHPHDGAVHLLVGESPEILRNVLVGDLRGLIEGLALDDLREDR